MRPVAFGEALSAGTRLTLFLDNKPERFFTVFKFWMDKTSGIALALKSGGGVTGRGIIQSADRGLAAKPAGAAMSPKQSTVRKTRSIVALQALPTFVP